MRCHYHYTKIYSHHTELTWLNVISTKNFVWLLFFIANGNTYECTSRISPLRSVGSVLSFFSFSLTFQQKYSIWLTFQISEFYYISVPLFHLHKRNFFFYLTNKTMCQINKNMCVCVFFFVVDGTNALEVIRTEFQRITIHKFGDLHRSTLNIRFIKIWHWFFFSSNLGNQPHKFCRK